MHSTLSFLCFFQIYFSISCISISLYLYEERNYLTGKSEKPTSKSFLGASPCKFSLLSRLSQMKKENLILSRFAFQTANVLFSMLFLGCAILGSFSSILVFIGLRKDQREFFVPWILVMVADILFAVCHFFYTIIFGKLKFEPLTGTLFTVVFFIICLNVRKIP